MTSTQNVISFQDLQEKDYPLVGQKGARLAEMAQAELPVRYEGVVPDNFTEEREVVVEGRLAPAGVFQADTLMTRCESKYQVKVK